MKEIAIIKFNNNSFEEYFSHAMTNSRVDIFSSNDICLEADNNLNPFDPRAVLGAYRFAKRNNLRKYKYVIIFDCYQYAPGIALCCGLSSKIIVWMWNTIGSAGHRSIGLLGMVIPTVRFATFDMGDAVSRSMTYVDQFYIRTDLISCEPGNSVFFIGLDKGRLEILKALSRQIPSTFVCDFHLVANMESSVKAEDSFLVHEEFMNYLDVIEHIRRSLAIVDIVKDGQVGMTLRVLEAVFFGKKLISNNVKLRETDIYATGNVYILGNESISLRLFLEQQTKEYPKHLLKKYSYDTWLNNIISI